MKVETPQILWNSDGDKGKNAPLYAVDILESGLAGDSSPHKFSHVLVTAGNTSTINLWKVCFGGNPSSENIFQKTQRPMNQIDYMLSLTRHDLPVNTVAFSPDGLHLVTAGEAGNIVLWSVPVCMRGNGNGRHFWSTIAKESDLSVRIVSTHADGVCDISWSADSKRFVVGTIDSNVLVFEDKNHDTNRCSPETHRKESDWQLVFRNGEHSSFVQGVAYDPLGVYIATMGSDRTVRIFPRKTPPKSKKKVLRPSNAPRGVMPPQDHQAMVSRLLSESKLEVGKTKRIKQRSIITDPTTGASVKQRLFVDESNCESFFRRLSWTVDGAYLVTPASLWHPSQGSPTFATFLFSRHRFDEPCRVLSGLEKPSVVVRPNPIKFELPASATSNSKENHQSGGDLPYRTFFAVLTLDTILIYDTHHLQPISMLKGLHYAGLTDCCWSRDGRNLMVSSTDGYITIVNFAAGELGKEYEVQSVSDSEIVPTEEKEIVPLTITPVEDLPTIPPCPPGQTTVIEARPAKKARKTRITPTLISSSPGSTPTLVAASMEEAKEEISNAAKRSIYVDTDRVGAAVTKLSLGGGGTTSSTNTNTNKHTTTAADTATTSAIEHPKKKKRIQPMLVSTRN